MWYRNNRRPRIFLWTLALSVILLIVWSYLVEIEQVVRAQGKVVPTGNNKLVQHLEGGIIAEILVQEGDIVEEGQPLFRIKNEFNKAELTSLEIERISLLIKLYRIRSQLEDKQNIVVPEELENRAPKVVASERVLLKDIYLNYVKRQQVLSSVWKRKQHRIKELTTQRKNLEKELELAKQEWKLSEKLLSKGAASEREVLDSQKRYQTIKTSYDRIYFSIPTARAESKEALGRYEQIKTDYKLKLQEELIKVQSNIAKIETKQKAFRDRQLRSEIVSSVKGIINKLMVNTIGGIIRPGDALASLTPLDTSLIIEAKVREADRAEIWLGQPVKVKLRAYDHTTHGSLDGEIVLISADSFSDNRQIDQYHYQVQIKVQQKINSDKPILPGMLSDVDMLTGKKRVLTYLTGPILRAWSRALQEQ
jgi:HlyD family secretion protein/adhesin transport system membrane fusion protein